MNELAVANYVDKVQKMALTMYSSALESNVKCALNSQKFDVNFTHILNISQC